MRARWWSRRAIGLHLTALVVVPGCLVATWWQADRALSGNALSYLYSFEWPFFAGYAVYMWWRLVHEQPAPANPEAVGEEVTGEPERASGSAGASSAPAHPMAASSCPQLAQPASSAEDEEDAALAAYNRYLAALAASGDPKRLTWRRRRART